VKLHPLHPVSAHAPLACLFFAPLADLGAALTGQSYFWAVGALMAAGAVVFGLVAATFGAIDFERAYVRAPKTVRWHAGLMATAVTLDGAGAFGRFDQQFAVLTPPTAWAIGLGVLASILAMTGGFFGGELVYRHGINVEGHPSNLPPRDG
jgi:uncharacterized membrane protein